MSLSTPSQITVPFANSGTRNDIPASADNSAGLAGYDLGFPPITTVAKLAGGLPPRGADFNGMFYDVTEAIRYLESGGQFPYNSAFSSAVGGYPLGALVMRSDGGGLWKNLVANNTTDPESSSAAGWAPLNSGITNVTMTSANYTLTNLQAANDIIVISGSLTANLNLIFPSFTKSWQVINNCTGSFTVTCKTLAGTGISIYSGGQSSIVYGDGTNISTSSGNSQIPLNVGDATAASHAVALGQLYTQKGIQRFTSSGSFTVPVGVTTIYASGCAGGSGGGGSNTTSSNNSGGGGGGGYGQSIQKVPYTVTPGQVIAITIGAGGAGGAIGTAGGAGGSTIVGSLITLAGAGGGQPGGAAGATSSGGIGGSGYPYGGYGTDSGATAGVGGGGWGASGPFGGGGANGRGNGGTAISGRDAYGYGSGGGGAGGVSQSVTGSGAAGGNGMPGVVIIEW
jgi:hypothetical protein